jgi:hypothetical protein
MIITHSALALGLLALLAVVPVLSRTAARELCATDALQAKAVAGLANFANWLHRNQASGFIGEVGWPANQDRKKWNNLAQTWYTAADRIGLPVTAWSAGSWPSEYPMVVYRSVPGLAGETIPGPQASVVQDHPSTDRYLRGVALAAGSFAAADTNGAFGSGNPGRYGLDYGYDNISTYHGLARHGVRLVRIAVNWERLQPVPFRGLAPVELQRVRQALDQAGKEHLKLILDLHGYGVFAEGGGRDGRVRHLLLGSPRLPTTALADFWRRMVIALDDTPGLVGYGLLNEPTHLAASGRAAALIWERASQQAVDAIRATGSRAVLTVSGYLPMGPGAWGQMHPHAWIKDPLHRSVYESHAYFDSDGSGHYPASYRQELHLAQAEQRGMCSSLMPLAGRLLLID